MIKYIILLGLARISLGSKNEGICKAQQVNAAFCVDGTTNVRPEQLKYIGQFIQHIANTFAEGSDGTCAFINDENTEIFTFKSPTEKYNLEAIEDATLVGNKVYSTALENEVTKRSTVSRYKKRADIFYLIVTDTTNIEEIPKTLLKKKLFVIVLGKEIPKRLEDLASSAKHIYLISRLEDVGRVGDLVARQTCFDSHLKCDVDQYMEKRSIKCKSCMSVCSSVTETQSDSCLRNCPYIRLPSKKGTEKPKPTLDSYRDDSSTIDPAKKTVLICSLIVVVVIVTILAVFIVVCWKRSRKFGTRRKIPQIEVHVSDPIQETRTPDAQRASFTNGTGHPLLEEDANNGGENADGYVLHFKDNELDMNGQVFGGPDFQDVN